MRVLAPLVRRSTYRRWVYLILGGALLVPYLILVTVAVPSMLPLAATVDTAMVIGVVLALLVMLVTSFIPAVRVLEGAAVRELLDDPVPGVTFGPAGSWSVRLRSGAMFLLHVVAGGIVSFLSLIVPVFLVLSIIGVFTGKWAIGTPDGLEVPIGWPGVWVPALLVVAVVALIYLTAGVGALLARAAAALLGVSAGDRIAELEKRTERLAERNRLARELHDSVGHALSVVTLQAGAARRILRDDPDGAERSLLAIEDSARAALDDLDHVLGLLRDEKAGTRPQAGLAELPALLSATRLSGATVHDDVRGDLAAVPAVVSREAYRIVQECLTNALRHAGKVPVTLVLDVGADVLELTVTNPATDVPRRRVRGGRGLRGMAERVDVLRGEYRAGRRGEQWEVAVRLPWGTAT
ncbi:sensor histidine kinase [Amycolatopsis suaedae]|uniref:histidine kinase n=1 Tax=Amycolatopsis suaedae TaxID=2510978 RepID=A0A4Q7JCT1_9PSEU|nr:histidine kinase [Amycolatopsis suaedae]RZQ65710.1 sensor histidine kinase [Amycolatopsis suaedae]